MGWPPRQNGSCFFGGTSALLATRKTHKSLQSLYTNISTEWDRCILAADAFKAGSWGTFWSKLVLPDDSVRTSGDNTRFESIVLNDQRMWHHSVQDARFLRRQAAQQWGLDYSHNDVCCNEKAPAPSQTWTSWWPCLNSASASGCAFLRWSSAPPPCASHADSIVRRSGDASRSKRRQHHVHAGACCVD